MIVATGRSANHLKYIAQDFIKEFEKHSCNVRVEGIEQGMWILIDAGDVIIHVFQEHTREQYNLEKMWSIDVEEIANG